MVLKGGWYTCDIDSHRGVTLTDNCIGGRVVWSQATSLTFTISASSFFSRVILFSNTIFLSKTDGRYPRNQKQEREQLKFSKLFSVYFIWLWR